MPTIREPFRVRVPGSTANLGPGFDVLGLALTLYDEFEVWPSAQRTEITIEGEGADQLARNGENLFVKAFAVACTEAGEDVPPLRVHMRNSIPLFRGLGSSSCAIVGGLVAGNYVLNNRWSKDELLYLAWRMEGHPDNVAAALFGGLIMCTLGSDERPICTSLPLPENLQVVVCIPDQPLPTELAREVVPKEVTLRDAVYNIGHTALLLAGLLKGDEHLIREGMQDRLHQPYRSAIFRPMNPIMQAALSSGACGSALSGAGSTVLALTFREPEKVAEAMVTAARRSGTDARGLVLGCAQEGAVVTLLPTHAQARTS